MPQADHPYHAFMMQAVRLAGNARWQTLPNPRVGAVLVQDGRIVAEGWHKGPGLAHAEVAALEDAAAKGVSPAACTLVVTLEPCRHYGKTPPCTEAILQAGIRHVVIGAADPNPEAAGGAEVLRSKGLQVEMGIAEQVCFDLLDDFIIWRTTDLPYVTLKLASTLDGRIASRSGHSKWITAPETRDHVHLLRRHVQAIIVGGNTFYHDDPKLTCRLENMSGEPQACVTQPLAVIVTSRLPEAGASHYLLKQRPESTMFWTTVAAAASPKAEALRRTGVRVLGLTSQARTDGRGHGMRAELSLEQGLAHLREKEGCRYVLCEGGGRLGLSLLEKGFAHELHLHLAPKILGDNEATPLFDGRVPTTIDEALKLRITEADTSGSDIILTIRPRTRPDMSSATQWDNINRPG